jgi:PE-PPE domain
VHHHLVRGIGFRDSRAVCGIGGALVRIAEKWVGWGLGPPADDDPKVAEFKKKLKRKFNYAKALDDTTRYTEELATVVMQAQTAWGFTATGIIDFKFQDRAGWVPHAAPVLRSTGPRGTLYTCQGTVPSDMWWGPQADVARRVEDLYYWQPIGGPYQAVPMNWSINQEKATLRLEIEKRAPGDRISMFGYSQGAIVVSEVFMEMRNPKDPLHYRFTDFYRVITIGNPSRELGVANGNRWCGYPDDYPDLGPNSRGIMENDRRMTDTPDFFYDFAHKKDMYTDTPNTDAGEDQTAICMIIMGDWWGGPDSIFHQMFEIVHRPIRETMAMFKAIHNAGLFFGGGIVPHLTYNVEPCIAYLRS